MEQYKDNAGNLYWVQPVPKDGNCLYSALAHQLYGLTPRNSLFPVYRDLLRANAVRELRNRPDLYQDTLEIYAADVPGNSPLDHKVKLFLRKLEALGSWGGEESIVALSNFHSTRIYIHQNNATLSYFPTVAEPTTECHILYRGSRNQRNHYDSVYCVRRASSILTAPVGRRVEIIRPTDRSPQLEVCTLKDDQASLMSAVLHQLTRTEVGEDTCSNLRCLIADEIVHLEPAVLTSLGIPIDNESLQTFIFRLKTGLQNGGVASLVLLSSLLGVTIYLYRYNQDTLRMNPADQAGSAAVHIYEHIADDSSTFSSVLRIVPDQPRLPQVPETTSDGKNPIIIADNISRTEFAGTPQSVHSSMTIPSHQGLRLGSLNVNGCRVSAKRDEIDALLVSHKVHVAVLQEVNLPCGEALSDHYHWHMGEPARNKRRGLAILVHRDYPIAIWHKKNQGSNIQYAQLVYQVRIAIDKIDLLNPNCNSLKDR